MLIKLSGSFVGIATSAFLISNKAYAKNAGDINSMHYASRNEVFKTIPRPKAKWNKNWDHRDPQAVYSKIENPPGDKCVIPSESRHLYLVRHGQYFKYEKSPDDKKLTKLGKEQAKLTGQRLKELELSFDKVIISTMPRAKDTGILILDSLPKDRIKSVEFSSLLPEGSPIPPEPPVGRERVAKAFYEDGARIEAAFRKYFHRASPSQKTPETVLLVCHANVIRYFVCRALQIPEEAWARFSLKNGSITHIEIRPSGRVIARGIGEAGFMPREMITTT